MKKTVKDMTLTNLNLKKYKIRTIRTLFPEAQFRVRSPNIGAFLYCYYVKQKYGLNAVHVGEKNLVEILNPNANGWGEIVITKTHPSECAFIRFKTGLFGKTIADKCRCGEEWILIPVEANIAMKPLKINLDYIINMEHKL